MTARENELGELLRKLRGSKSQDEFQKELQRQLGEGEILPKKYVSLVETGARERLATAFVKAVARFTGQTPDQVEESYRRAAASEPPMRLAADPLRVVMGHTVWGAAVLAAALRGWLPGIKVATCAKVSELEGVRRLQDISTLSKAAFIEGNVSKGLRPASVGEAVWVAPKPGGRPPLEDEALFADVETALRISPLSAGDALAWLKQGWADVAAVPRALFNEDKSLLRVGQLVDSSAGCTLLCTKELGQCLIGNDDWKSVCLTWGTKSTRVRRFDRTTHDLGRAIGELRSRHPGKHIGIGAERGTVAQRFLEEACEDAREREECEASRIQVNVQSRLFHIATFEGIRDFIGRVQNGNGGQTVQQTPAPAPASTSRRSMPRESTKESGRQAGSQETRPGAPRELLGLITWEPHATWLLNRSREASEDPLAAISLRRSPDPTKHCPRHLEFDLVIQNSRANDAALVRHISHLLTQVWQVSEELARLKPGALHDLIEPLARYYGVNQAGDISLTSSIMMDLLGPVRFDVAPAMESKHLLFKV